MPINIATGGWSELDLELAVNKAGYAYFVHID